MYNGHSPHGDSIDLQCGIVTFTLLLFWLHVCVSRACDRQLWFCTLRCYRNQAGRIKAFFYARSCYLLLARLRVWRIASLPLRLALCSTSALRFYGELCRDFAVSSRLPPPGLLLALSSFPLL